MYPKSWYTIYVDFCNSFSNLIFGELFDYCGSDKSILNGSEDLKLDDEGKLRAAMYRLIYPINLEDKNKEEYIEICKKTRNRVAQILIEDKDIEAVRILFDLDLLTNEQKDKLSNEITK